MKIRNAILLTVACVSVSAAASAHMIAVDKPQDALAARSLDLKSTEGSAGAALFNDHAALGRAKLDRRTEKGTWNAQIHRGSEGDEAALVPDQHLVAATDTTTVSVPEPATVGLMGFGLLLLTAFTRRARGERRGSTPV